MTYRVCVLPGDGIGPDVTAAALHVLGVAADRYGFEVETEEHPFGGAGIDAAGDPLPPAVLAAAKASDAVLKGPVGGPRWDGGAVRPRAGDPAPAQRARRVRQPAARPPGHRAGHEPAAARAGRGHRPDHRPRADRRPVLRRAGPRRRPGLDTCVYTAGEIRRIARRAFELARTRRGGDPGRQGQRPRDCPGSGARS